MTRIMRTAAIAAGVLATAPAHASGLGDLARIVLGSGSVLQRGADTCGNRLALAPGELLALSMARQAAQSALPGEQFLTLDTMANSNAVTASQKPGFCNQTARRKNVLLDAVKKAGQKLVTARVLGL